MKNLGRLAVLVSMSAGLALSAAGCGTGPRYEDCEVNDQYVNGDVKASQLYEPDCGFWTRGSSHFLHNGFLGDATWTYWSWVVIGQNSYAPENWKPPHGLKPPTESKDAAKRRKTNEKKIKQEQERVKKEQKRQEELRKKQQNQAPTDTKNGNGVPRTGSGNQGIPKNNTAPKPVTKPR